MKTARMMQWCDVLDTTTDAQANGTMVNRDSSSGGLSYCCLAIGERIANPKSPHLVPNEWGQASREFVEWLGIYDDEADNVFDPNGDGADPSLDWPAEYRRAGLGFIGAVTCASLNDDWHLTFPQIADMIRYFGLLPMRARRPEDLL